MNPMGIYLNQRNFFTSGASGFLTNVNRVFPGTLPSDGGNNAELLAYNVWNNLWGNKSQVDVGIDLRKRYDPLHGSMLLMVRRYSKFGR